MIFRGWPILCLLWGLASIAAYLGKKNIDVTIVDCYAKPNSDAFIKDHLQEVFPEAENASKLHYNAMAFSG